MGRRGPHRSEMIKRLVQSPLPKQPSGAGLVVLLCAGALAGVGVVMAAITVAEWLS